MTQPCYQYGSTFKNAEIELPLREKSVSSKGGNSKE